jgi:hypothetical protein
LVFQLTLHAGIGEWVAAALVVAVLLVAVLLRRPQI